MKNYININKSIVKKSGNSNLRTEYGPYNRIHKNIKRIVSSVDAIQEAIVEKKIK